MNTPMANEAKEVMLASKTNGQNTFQNFGYGLLASGVIFAAGFFFMKKSKKIKETTSHTEESTFLLV